jgi:ribosomal-protein-alanine N-acetyltransferase
VQDQAELRTTRLHLRPFRADDAARVHVLIDDAGIARNTLTIPHPYPPGLAERWIAGHADEWASGRKGTWALCLTDGELVGAAGLYLELTHRRAELGYWIARTHWGRGLATEAVLALVDHAFDDLALERVFAHHLPWNPASGRVLTKAGLRREGLLRGHVQKDGRATDTVLYGLTLADRTPPD